MGSGPPVTRLGEGPGDVWMYFYGDYHMHTKYSDGRGSLEQMVQAARKKGLKEIAVTDHGPRNIGVGIRNTDVLLKTLDHARALNRLFAGEFRILVGVEADVISCQGDIDVPREVYSQLDLLLVGLHPHIIPATAEAAAWLFGGNKFAALFPPVRDAVARVNTCALVSALEKHPVDIVTHPGLGMPVDISQVARVCTGRGIAFEINTGHDYITPSQVLRAVEEGAKIIVNSDAHYPETVGELQAGWEVLLAAGVDADRVVNLSEKGRRRLTELKEHRG